MKKLIFSILLLSVAATAAENTSTDAEFDSLGGNKIFLEKAQALQPEQKMTIVQNRTVSLDKRFEIAPEFSGTFGGDTYSRTRSFGLNAMFHMNSHWALGAKYNYAFNTLTPEGQARVDQANADYQKNPEAPSVSYPQLDYPKSEMMALFNWSPIYGKLNLFDASVAHFDAYLVAGYGQVQLSSGTTPTYTGGLGLGFWLTPHFSTRVEMRYQNYKAQYFQTEKSLDLAVASVQMGWLL
jgi:outer membrane beta-barrel protein